MNTESFVDLFDEKALVALKPMLVLSVGILGVLLAGVIEPMRKSRVPILVGALLLAFLGEIRIGQEEPGLDLAGAMSADRTTALWGAIFLIGFLQMFHVIDRVEVFWFGPAFFIAYGISTYLLGGRQLL